MGSNISTLGCVFKSTRDNPIQKIEKSLSLAEQADSMQEVLNDLFLGSKKAAENKPLLLQNGITHILAIGYDLKKVYDGEFTYLLLNGVLDSPECNIIGYFSQCFAFMDAALQQSTHLSPHKPDSKRRNRLFVHCHKGLSRSATVVIAYEMMRKQQSFEIVCDRIRENRPFILPNIGFQAQLHAFAEAHYSLNMDDYIGLSQYRNSYISDRLPDWLQHITQCEYLHKNARQNDINESDMLHISMYIHQCYKLYKDGILAHKNDCSILLTGINCLRRIQTDYVRNPRSLARFDQMFDFRNGLQMKTE